MEHYTLEALVPNLHVRLGIAFLLACWITAKSIPVIINFGDYKKLMDNPVKRSSHYSPIPTFGGVAIFSGTLIGYLLWNFGDEGFVLHKMIAGFTILFFLGVKDDILVLDPTKKLLSQIIAAGLVVLGGDLRLTNFFGIFGIYGVPYVISVLITIILFVIIINAFNFIDGIDGLSAGIGMINSLFFGSWFMINGHWSLAAFALCLAGSLFVFLFFNFSNTQKIFMGDTGSLIIGFAITIFAIRFTHFNSSYSFRTDTFVSAPILILVSLSVPLFDFFRVIIVRIAQKRKPWKGDREHLHHILIDIGFSHMQASFLLYGITFLLILFTYYLRSFFTNTQLMVVIAGYFVLYMMVSDVLNRWRIRKSKPLI